MPDTELTVDVEADVSAVDDAVDAIRELDDALAQLEERGVNITVNSPGEGDGGRYYPAGCETERVDMDVAQELGDRLAEVIAAEHDDVAPGDVHVFGLEAPNRVRYRLDSSDDRDALDETQRGIARALESRNIRR